MPYFASLYNVPMPYFTSLYNVPMPYFTYSPYGQFAHFIT